MSARQERSSVSWLLEGVWKLKVIRRYKVKERCLLLLGKEHETRITGLCINKEWRREFLNKQDRQCSYNTEALSCKHCCSGKAISIIYSECVFVALVIQHAMHMRHIVICGLPGSKTFFHII